MVLAVKIGGCEHASRDRVSHVGGDVEAGRDPKLNFVFTRLVNVPWHNNSICNIQRAVSRGSAIIIGWG